VLVASPTGTENLLPLTVGIPSGIPAGDKVTLSTLAGARVAVWDNSSPSVGSTPLLGGISGKSSITWTVGTDTIPAVIYGGATAGSATVGDIGFTLAAEDPSLQPPHPATSQPATAASFRIRSLGFGGTGENTIARDNGAGVYDEQSQWLDGNLNGAIDGTPNLAGTIDGNNEHNFPLSYVRSLPNNPDVIQVTITLANAFPVGTLIEGVTNYNNITFSAVAVAANDINNGKTTLTLTANNPLPGTIDSNNITVSWEYSIAGGQYIVGEQTTNHIYVTGAVAAGAYETMLYIGCNAAKGLSPHNSGQPEPAASTADQAVINAIWQTFTGLKVLEVDGAQGTLLTYYKPGFPI
jgi:hypothetical protein